MATYYVDYATGANNTYTTLTSCVASNPSGTITRITKNAHGLVDGNIVVLSQFSAWLNGQWTVTNAQTNTFDLQGAVWQTTADATGDVVRVWGRKWSEPWDKILRQIVVANDIVKVAKTPDPVSIGNATWTNKSITITLATAQTTLIDDADSGWVAAAGGDVTVSTNTTRKSGTARTVFTFDAAIQTNIKQAYKTLPAALDLSAYDSITFWFQNSSSIADNNRLKIALCSDTTGDTIVDEFFIPQIAQAGSAMYVSLDLTRNGGGALGTNINSIALYTRGAAIIASTNYSIDNINACNANGLNLNTLISKSSTAWNWDEIWCPIKSINGTTVIIDNAFSNTTMTFGNKLRGYYTTGTSPETVTTYIMKPYQPPMTDSSSSTNSTSTAFDYAIGSSGPSATNPVQFIGGWNKDTDTRDGMTWVNRRGSGKFLYMTNTNGLEWSYFGGMRMEVCFDPSRPSGSGTGITHIKGEYLTSVACVDGGTTNTFSSGFSSPIINYQLINNCSYRAYGASQLNASSANLKCVSNEAYSRLSFSPMKNTYMWNIGEFDSTSEQYYMYSSSSGQEIWEDLEFRDCESWIFMPRGSGNVQNTFNAFPPTIKNLTILNHSPVNNKSPFYFPGGINSIGYGATKPTKIINASITMANASTRTFDGTFNTFTLLNSTTNSTNKQPNSGQLYGYNGSIIYDRYNGSDTDYRYYQYFWEVISQTTERHTASGIAWQMNITTQKLRTTNDPTKYKISTIAVNANSQVTYKVWVKKTHATNIDVDVIIFAGSLPGINSNITATAANNTNWQELTLTFTPTTKGVVDVYMNGYASTGPYTNSIYIDDVTVTQA